jgi:putative ABC transport system permease protein
VGCLLGLGLAQALLSLMVGTAPPQLRFLTNVSPELDWRALAFAAATASATCLVVGLLPAWRTSRVDAIDALKQRALGVIGSRDDWWQGALVASQLAFVLVLLAGSGLLLRSFTRLVQVDPGFEVERTAVVTLQLRAPRYGQPGQAVAFMRELERKVEATPGVVATISGGVPPTGGGFYFDVAPEAEGFAKVGAGDLEVPYQDVAPDYFETMGIVLGQGRTFERGDPNDVVIVNDVMARRLWSDASPIGRRFRVDADQPWWTVIGVAGDVKAMGPSDPMGEGMEFYRPLADTARGGFFAMVVRGPGDAERMLPALKQRVWELDPKQPIVDAETMATRIDEAVVRPQFFMRLALAFAVTATLLGAVGVYGVAAYWVSRRNRELAIRVALGASRAQVVNMVMTRSVRLAAAGCVAGLGLAFWGARAIESMLFQVDANDPVTLVTVTVMLGLLALIASTLPAVKASRVDPMSVLRAE